MHDTARRGVAVGFFDGVHLGHRKILACAARALTFRNHPLAVLRPGKAPRLIMDFAARERAMLACGLDEVRALDFTLELAAMPAEDFAREYLAGEVVYCGANWRFGRGGEGDAALLRRLGCDVRVCGFAELDGERISSTRIRRAIEEGAIETANAMLGRPWRIAGGTVRGKGAGRGLGFPTINIVPEHLELRPPRGVYAVRLGGARGVANFGVAPTFGARAWPENMLEVHLLDCTEDPWRAGEEAATDGVEMVSFVRGERTFASQAALAAQIALDCAAAAARL